MKKSNSHGDDTIRPFPGDTRDETRSSGEGSLPPDSPNAKSKIPASGLFSFPAWTVRLKQRWKSMLAWLAKGAEHSCPS